MEKRRPPITGPLSGGRAGDVADPGEPMARTTPPGEAPGWRIVRGLLAAVAVGAGLVALIAGIWLWSNYVPEGWVSFEAVGTRTVGSVVLDASNTVVALDRYATAWVVLGLAATAWLGVALVTSPTSRRILATGALVALVGAALVAWTAPRLAWDEVVVSSVVPGGPGGLHVDGDVQHYLIDGEEVGPRTYEALLAGHVLGASLVAIGLLSGGLLARARRRRPDDGSLDGR